MRVPEGVGARLAPAAPVALVILASVVASAAILVLPTAGMKIAVVATAAGMVAWLLASWTGRLLNAAWAIVLALYLLDPGSVALPALGSPIPMVVVSAIAPVPFALTALWLRPASRQRLLRLAPIVALVALGGLSLAWSPDVSYGGRKLGLWVLTGLIPCGVILALASPSRPVAWRVVIVAAFAYSIVLLAFGTTTLYPGRLVVFDANPIWIARAVFVGALVVLFGPVPRLAKVVLLPPMLVAGYLTDSLGPTLGLVLGAALGIAELIRVSSMPRRRARLAWASLAIATALGLTALFALASAAPPALLAPIVQDPNVTSRALYLNIAAGLFANAPLLGSGLGAFAATGAADLYPHNMFAEVASELGIAGLALLLWWVVLAVRGAVGSPLLVALVAGTTTFVLFSGNLAGNAEFWIFSGVAVAMLPVRWRAAQPSLVPVT